MEQEFKYKSYNVKIEPDEDSQNPITDWDMLGTFSCFHDRYDLSNTKEFDDKEELKHYLSNNKVIYLPLYLYDHSGITIKTTPFGDSWDSGQVGFIFASYEKIKKEYNCKYITKKIIEKVKGIFVGEVKVFDDYLTGNVYQYTIEDAEGNHCDSCGGFYETVECLITETKQIIDNITDVRLKDSQLEMFPELVETI